MPRPRLGERTVRLAVAVPRELLDVIDAYAQERGMTRSEAVRNLLRCELFDDATRDTTRDSEGEANM